MRPQTIPIHTLDGRYLGCIVNERPALVAVQAKAGGRTPLSRALRTGATAEPIPATPEAGNSLGCGFDSFAAPEAFTDSGELMRNHHDGASSQSNLPHAEPYGRKGQHDHGA